jgi:AcrR family transcriptional regulator
MNKTQQDSPTEDTQARILDAAESLFVEHGYSGTSMRAIAEAAKVNLAATNYHFGSKQGLLAAVFHRRIHPINIRRLLLIKALKDSDRSLTLRGILDAFFDPLKTSLDTERGPALVGRIFGEPDSVTKPILEQEFGEVSMAYQQALAEVLPDISLEDLRWRFHFMIGAMIQLLRFHAPLGSESTPQSFISGIEHLISFVEAGLTQSNNGQPHD